MVALTSLTVLTYNVLGAAARKPLAAVVTALTPDVILVNESPRSPLVWRWQCSRLAGEWGLRRVAGGRDAGRNLLCAAPRVEVVDAVASRLPQPQWAPRRGIVSAQCRLDGAEFGVVGVHLSLSAPGRVAEARAAVAAAERLRGPVMVCGDLNELPGRGAWRVFATAGFQDFGAPHDATFSSTDRRKRIDAVLVRDAEVLSYGVPPEPAAGAYAEASDHCPVRAVIAIAD